MKKLTLIIFTILCSLSVQAQTQGDICYKYQRQDYTWSKAYKLTAQVVSGDQMVKATSNYVKYSSIYNYVVIHWNNGGYSALKANSWEDSISSLPYSYRNTKDQNGNTVKFKQGSTCY